MRLVQALALLLGLLAEGEVRLQGRVLDVRRSPLAGIVVELRGTTPDRVMATTTTDPSGRFSFDIASSTEQYTLSASSPEHALVSLGPLSIGSSTSMDITLYARAQLQETVQVDGVGDTVPLEGNPDLTVFGELAIEGLPLVGRQITDLLLLAPGVTDPDQDGRLNVRGARDTGLQLRVDGTNVTDPLTGHFGQDVNLETVEEIQVVTSGAPAEYGRADGGFASVITKSGGNDFTSSLKLYVRSSFLDGDGANGDRNEVPSFTDSSAYGTFGGPIVKDHLWYFASVQVLDREIPVVLAGGPTVITSAEGTRPFFKLTWQANLLNKLTAQISADPLDMLGNNIGLTVDPETDYQLTTGGPLVQTGWTSVLSPDLLLTGLISSQSSGQDIEPISGDFSPVRLERVPLGPQTVLPLPCTVTNCRDDQGFHTFFMEDTFGSRRRNQTLFETGPYPVSSDQRLRRSTLRSDLSYVRETSLGQHSIKAGFEGNYETYTEERVQNPTLTDRTCEFLDCNIGSSAPVPRGTRYGLLSLQAYEPVVTEPHADGFNLGLYLQDAWKIRPNVVINAGVRLDFEEVDSVGYTQFDPLAESKEANHLFDLVCEAFGNACTNSHTPGRRDGNLPSTFTPPPGDPSLVLDRNGDGTLQTEEIALINEPFTQESDLAPEAFNLSNTNVSPRFSVSWDPFSDGSTRFSGSFGRYYDRLFLGTVATEQQPFSYVAEWWLFGITQQAEPGDLSRPLTGAVSINQTNRDLSTPYTDELSLGFERELAPEWSVALLYINRKGENLLQDIDNNHISCTDFDTAYGVSPHAVCGDGGGLELDRFGRVIVAFLGGANVPNGAIDLYHHNPRFNQILRIENANGYRYKAVEARLRKRLHRNWQMDASYTWSEATGEAESFVDSSGNDPAVSDKVSGHLSYDQRHVFKFQSVAHLKRDFLLGGTILWESGLPYSIIENVEDYDDTGNLTAQRLVSVTGKKNDQRNESRLTLNVHVEKRFNAGDVQVSGFLDIENLLDSDDLLLQEVNGRSQIIEGERRFGRYLQMGVAVLF
ncbi:MAG: TonB-dependent receptor domain-containing protein [Candidatus Polarisedimenticolia bacterium]